jgi:7,8-dihydropterin-6-yl-methyl-4-(beta-D-ribofuranosyl)aminobenzene 5'-phosphate synthase
MVHCRFNTTLARRSSRSHRGADSGGAGAPIMTALLSLCLLTSAAPGAGPSDSPPAPDDSGAAGQPPSSEPDGEIALRIVYDNVPHTEGLETAWGFSCVITGCEKTILFDTGGEGDILMRNMQKCGVEPRQIDVVVLSHTHGDHTGGLDEFLAVNSHVEVYLPKAFPGQFKEQVRGAAEKVIETDGPQEICAGVCTTGVLMEPIPEQGISIDTPEGILVITGCAHPGIVEIVRAAHEHTKKPVHLALGGFHLVRATQGRVDQVIDGLRKLSVQKIAPTHCTGDEARRRMKDAFGEHYLDVGVGRRLTFSAGAKKPA